MKKSNVRIQVLLELCDFFFADHHSDERIKTTFFTREMWRGRKVTGDMRVTPPFHLKDISTLNMHLPDGNNNIRMRLVKWKLISCETNQEQTFVPWKNIHLMIAIDTTSTTNDKWWWHLSTSRRERSSLDRWTLGVSIWEVISRGKRKSTSSSHLKIQQTVKKKYNWGEERSGSRRETEIKYISVSRSIRFTSSSPVTSLYGITLVSHLLWFTPTFLLVPFS